MKRQLLQRKCAMTMKIRQGHCNELLWTGRRHIQYLKIPPKHIICKEKIKRRPSEKNTQLFSLCPSKADVVALAVGDLQAGPAH